MADHEVKGVQFWAKLDTNYRFTLKNGIFFEKLNNVNFEYFMYLIKILQYSEKTH